MAPQPTNQPTNPTQPNPTQPNPTQPNPSPSPRQNPLVRVQGGHLSILAVTTATGGLEFSLGAPTRFLVAIFFGGPHKKNIGPPKIEHFQGNSIGSGLVKYNDFLSMWPDGMGFDVKNCSRKLLGSSFYITLREANRFTPFHHLDVLEMFWWKRSVV